ncbi:hypothetical protein M0R45_031083 [Rubus argutus]|uniref:Uncharacterized protein n=1 Tax=Rubus argutus TaxID=59490 RepID=A0AAW1WD21_RUBAR
MTDSSSYVAAPSREGPPSPRASCRTLTIISRGVRREAVEELSLEVAVVLEVARSGRRCSDRHWRLRMNE